MSPEKSINQKPPVDIQSPLVTGVNEVSDKNDGVGARAKRTLHRERAQKNAADLMEEWQERSKPTLQIMAGNSVDLDEGPKDAKGGEVKTLLLGAGRPLGYSLDDATQYLELEADLGHAYQPRTAQLARATRDIVAATVGLSLEQVDLKALLWLDQISGKAMPQWCLRFSERGVSTQKMREVEGNLRAMFGLAAATDRTLWEWPENKLLPNNEAASSVVKAAKDLRTAAPGKEISPDCVVTCSDFEEEIKLPLKLGGRRTEEDSCRTRFRGGEVVGYNRSSRKLHYLIDGHQVSTDINYDHEIFHKLVRSLADEAGNKCQIWYRIERENGKDIRTTVRKLRLVQNDLFAQVVDFQEAELEDDSED